MLHPIKTPVHGVGNIRKFDAWLETTREEMNMGDAF
jgi:hypothetical protein